MSGKSQYLRTLVKDVIDNSESKNWEDAVTEWEIYDVEEDELLEESCICGKEHLRYLFTIKNQLNSKQLYPIGSSCIKKFERDDLKNEVDIKEQLFKLLHAVEENKFLQLSSDYFSRKLLRYLFEIGAFKKTEWNYNNPEIDYQFMLKMFNKRTRTNKQERKTKAILVKSIKPFLQNYLADKVKKH